MTAEARSVVVRLTAETAQYIREMQKAGVVGEASMTKVEASSHRSSAALDDVGRSAGRMALGGAAALTLLATAGIQWESDWAGVTKTVDGTVAQMAELEDGLRGLAKTLPASHTEIAGVAEAAGQLGVAREDIVDFTKTMVDLGETTNLTADQAATDIAQISNVMDTGADEVDNLGASLVALGNDGASTEAQILSMAQRIAGAGAQIGLAESDILAIANAAASMGIEVEAGGSAVSRVFTSMAKAAAQGGEKLEAFAEVAGVSADEFARAFEEDPARAFASFTEGLNRINQSGGDVFTTLDQLKLSDVRVSQALLGMAASGDLLTESLDLGAQAWEENTALAIEAGKRYDTTAARTQVAWNKIKDAGIEASDVLLPVVGAIADKVGTVADAFGRLPDPVQSSATQLLAVGTITSGTLWLGASIISKVHGFNDSLATLAETSPKTARGLSLVTKGVAGLTIGILAYNAAKDAFDIGIDDEDVRRQTELIAARYGDDVQAQIEATTALMEEQQRIADEAVSNAEFAPGFLTIFPFSQGAADAANTAEAYGKVLEELRHQQQLQFTSGVEATKAIDGNALAYFGLTDAADDSTDASEDLTGATRGVGRAHALTEKQVKALKEAYREEVDAARGVAREFLDISEGADDAKVSLREWIAQMEEQAQALENFTANAVEAGRKGVKQGLIDQLEQLGPVGALRMKQLANATDEEIARANAAFKRGKQAVDDYIAATTKKPKLDIDNTEALRKIRETESALAGMDDKYIDIFITQHEIKLGGGGKSPPTGGGDGTPRKTTTGGANQRGLVPSLASRGFPTTRLPTIDLTDVDIAGLRQALRGFAVDVSLGADGVASEVDELRRSLRESGGVWTRNLELQSQALIHTAEQYDSAAASLDRLQAAADSFQAAVAGSFNTDVLGGNLAQLGAGLTGDITNIAAMQQTLALLAQAGLDTTGPRGALYAELAKSGNLNLAQQLLASGASGIDYYESLYAQRAADQVQFGQGQEQIAMSQGLREQTLVTSELRTQMQELSAGFTTMVKTVEGIPQHMKRPIKEGSREGTYQGITKAASGAGKAIARNGS